MYRITSTFPCCPHFFKVPKLSNVVGSLHTRSSSSSLLPIWGHLNVITSQFHKAYSINHPRVITIHSPFLGLYMAIIRLSCHFYTMEMNCHPQLSVKKRGRNRAAPWMLETCRNPVNHGRNHGITMEYTWNTHGIHMEYTWNTHGIHMEYTWIT